MKPLIAFVIALSTFSVAAADESGRAFVRKKILSMTPLPQVAERCGTTRNVRGCTYFVGQRLTSECRLCEEGWQIDARAEFVAVVFLTDAAALRHENLHISDILESADEYVARLSARTYESRTACEMEAASQTGRFDALMDSFKIASNHRRHSDLLVQPLVLTERPPAMPPAGMSSSSAQQ